LLRTIQFYILIFILCTDSNLQKNDLIGNYEGIIPCADCPGIKMVLQLCKNSKYRSSLTYIDRNTNFTETGLWSLQKSEEKKETIINLESEKTKSRTYLLVLNNSTLELLDSERKRIKSNLNFKLHRNN